MGRHNSKCFGFHQYFKDFKVNFVEVNFVLLKINFVLLTPLEAEEELTKSKTNSSYDPHYKDLISLFSEFQLIGN